jgi:hypothetical protein
MKKVHLIPTDKPSRLGRFVDTGNLFLRTPNDLPRGENVNVYITYDSKIREGYYLDLTHNIVMKSVFYPSSDKNCKKIILTTDPILIQSGVQEIDEDFLEWLVQNPSCDSVKIDLVPVNEFGSEITVGGYGFDKFKYKIIPKEEPKQETLEEAAEHHWKMQGLMALDESTKPYIIQDFTAGAKWQQEQDKNKFSEEEVLNILHNYRNHFELHRNLEVLPNMFFEWFSQFKKQEQ